MYYIFTALVPDFLSNYNNAIRAGSSSAISGQGGMDGYVRLLLTPLSIMYCTRAVLNERKTISFRPISPNNNNETISSF